MIKPRHQHLHCTSELTLDEIYFNFPRRAYVESLIMYFQNIYYLIYPAGPLKSLDHSYQGNTKALSPRTQWLPCYLFFIDFYDAHNGEQIYGLVTTGTSVFFFLQSRSVLVVEIFFPVWDSCILLDLIRESRHCKSFGLSLFSTFYQSCKFKLKYWIITQTRSRLRSIALPEGEGGSSVLDGAGKNHNNQSYLGEPRTQKGY